MLEKQPCPAALIERQGTLFFTGGNVRRAEQGEALSSHI
jgi:hypothetical protein